MHLSARHEIFSKLLIFMVPGGGIEPPTRGFSIHCSTPELPGHGNGVCRWVDAFYDLQQAVSRGFLTFFNEDVPGGLTGWKCPGPDPRPAARQRRRTRSAICPDQCPRSVSNKTGAARPLSFRHRSDSSSQAPHDSGTRSRLRCNSIVAQSGVQPAQGSFPPGPCGTRPAMRLSNVRAVLSWASVQDRHDHLPAQGPARAATGAARLARGRQYWRLYACRGHGTYREPVFTSTATKRPGGFHINLPTAFLNGAPAPSSPRAVQGIQHAACASNACNRHGSNTSRQRPTIHATPGLMRPRRPRTSYFRLAPLGIRS